MQPQRRQEDATVVEFSFHHIDAVNVHRPCGAIENRLFSMPLTSAFHSYHGDLQHQLSCDADHYQEHQTGRSDEDDVHNTGGNDHDVTAGDDGLRGEDGTSDRRGGDTKHDVVVGGAPVTPRKQHYSVAELLRDDRPEVGPPDSRRHDEPRTSPSQPADSAFHISWNVEQAGRPTAPLPPLFGPPTAHNHRWTEWIASEAWRRSEFDDGTRQRCFGLFDTPSVNFVSSYMTGNIRHSTELQLPLSASAQQYSTVCTPHRPREKRDHQQHQQQQQQQQHDSVGRRQRTTFSAEQTLQLEVEYQRVEYVARPRRCELAQSLGLTDTQVKIWFQNRRAKDKRIEKAHVDRHIRSMQMMYSLNKNKGCLLDHVVDAHSRPSLPLPTARSLHPTTLRDARRNAIHRNWQTMH